MSTISSCRTRFSAAGFLCLFALAVLNGCFIFRGSGCDCPAYSQDVLLNQKDTIQQYRIMPQRLYSITSLKSFSSDAANGQ